MPLAWWQVLCKRHQCIILALITSFLGVLPQVSFVKTQTTASEGNTDKGENILFFNKTQLNIYFKLLSSIYASCMVASTLPWASTYNKVGVLVMPYFFASRLFLYPALKSYLLSKPSTLTINLGLIYLQCRLHRYLYQLGCKARTGI